MKRLSAMRFACLLIGLAFFSSATVLASPDISKIKVMSRNLYIGADIFRVVEAATNPEAGPLDVPMAVAEIYNIIQYTDFEERAAGIADDIIKLKPHLIGLQEVSTILTQAPGDYLLGNPTDATDVVYDYLDILMAALASRKLQYEVAVIVRNADVELPMFAGFTPEDNPIFNDVRLIDHDVILVRKNVAYRNPIQQNYETNINLDLGGQTIEFTRGYGAVDAEIDDIVYRFINTHLEVYGGPDDAFSAVQAAQMDQLLSWLRFEPKPVILVGDLNSDPEDGIIFSDTYGAVVPPYMQALNAGYDDVWSLQKKPAKMTCCLNETVDDPEAFLYERIDHILVKPDDDLQAKKTKVRTTDVRDKELTPNGLWPSDHAGVFGRILFLETD